MENGQRRYAQGKFWMATIPQHAFTPYLPKGIAYIRGQLETGNTTGFIHWQLLVTLERPGRLRALTNIFGDFHFELTRSNAADEYVWKDDTAINGTRFELGNKPRPRADKRDWESIWTSAKEGTIETIDKSVLVPYYNAITRIRKDNLKPIAIERTVICYWGDTGTGKSRQAWDDAGFDAYPKDPRTKFWDGYNNHENVVMDEFRGAIDISHLLRWFDRYPVIVECKGSSQVLAAKQIWITSNLDPRQWYPEMDTKTLDALLRRLKITHFNKSLLNYCISIKTLNSSNRNTS